MLSRRVLVLVRLLILWRLLVMSVVGLLVLGVRRRSRVNLIRVVVVCLQRSLVWSLILFVMRLLRCRVFCLTFRRLL